MRSRAFTAPVLVAFMAIWGSVLIWWAAPPGLMAEWRVYIKASCSTVLIPAVLAIGSFSLGAFFSRFISSPTQVARVNVTKLLPILNSASTFATLLLIANTVRKYGAGALSLAMSGRIKMAHVTGVTTLSILSTAVCVVSLAQLLKGASDKRQRSALWLNLVWGWVLAVTRAVVNGERIAVYIPLLASLLTWFALRNFRIRLRHVVIVCITLVALFGIYTGSEYLRSYGTRLARNQTQQTAFEYSRDRLLLYYAMSVNAGASRFGYFQEGLYDQPVFAETLNPLAQIIYPLAAKLGYRPVMHTSLDWTILEGVRIEEFNNFWGVATPFLEGYIVGILYWLIWGFVLSLLFKRHVNANGDVLLIATWAIAMVGLIDASRVSLLGASHILIPVFVLVAIYFLSRKRRVLYVRSSHSSKRPVSLLVAPNGNSSKC